MRARGDTAQVYRNEKETGAGIAASGLPRESLYITTKYSGRKDLETSIQDSLEWASRSGT